MEKNSYRWDFSEDLVFRVAESELVGQKCVKSAGLEHVSGVGNHNFSCSGGGLTGCLRIGFDETFKSWFSSVSKIFRFLNLAKLTNAGSKGNKCSAWPGITSL